MFEQWKPVVGYEGLYEVSDHGRVRRPLNYGKSRGGPVAGRILAIRMDKYGYPYLTLANAGAQKTCLVHHLVMAAFLGPRPEGLQANHIDGRKENNTPQNLEYVTHAENMRHSARLGLTSSGEKHPSAKLSEVSVRIIRLLKGKLSQVKIGELFGVSHNTIGHIHNGKTWKQFSLGKGL